MSTLRVKPSHGPLEYHIFIGAIKIAEICFNNEASRWKCYLRLMRNDVSYEVKDHFESMSEALKALHKLLNSPSPEGATVGTAKKEKSTPND